MTPPALQFSHMGLYVTDLAAMRDFYTSVLGFLVTDEGGLRGGGERHEAVARCRHHHRTSQPWRLVWGFWNLSGNRFRWIIVGWQLEGQFEWPKRGAEAVNTTRA